MGCAAATARTYEEDTNRVEIVKEKTIVAENPFRDPNIIRAYVDKLYLENSFSAGCNYCDDFLKLPHYARNDQTFYEVREVWIKEEAGPKRIGAWNTGRRFKFLGTVGIEFLEDLGFTEQALPGIHHIFDLGDMSVHRFKHV